ncbi:ATP-binding protein [Pantoea stewartii]|uniref:ATP-binding protein n=1 Tax=Pantoea stewartii TaxID=66269 RepID=UPI00345BCF5F
MKRFITNHLGMDDKLLKLLGDDPLANLVGYVYKMDFNEALILTNDSFKERVAGVPHNSFLVATSLNPENVAVGTELDREVILLRVLGSSKLPTDDDFVKTRIEHNQRRTSNEVFANDKLDGLDVLTHSELQAGGLKCRILGTFFIDKGALRLGSDIENYMSSNRLRVFKPRAKALELIVNHVNEEVKKKALEEAIKSGFRSMPTAIDIGTVRYTSTSRLHRAENEPLVTVQIQPTDFLARRTAILGMTRTGKSNTLKTTVSSVAISAAKDKTRVGQIIFDINGEYANLNQQDDGSSIAEVFKDDVVRYRGMHCDDNSVRDLRNNFYEQPDIGLNIIQDILKDENITASDMRILVSSLSLEQLPEDATESEKSRHDRNLAAFKSLLHSRGFPAPKDLKVKLNVSKDVKRQILEHCYPEVVNDLKESLGKRPSQEEIKNRADEFLPNYSEGVSLQDLVKFFTNARDADKKIRKAYEAAEKEAKNKDASVPNGLWRSLRSKKDGDDWLDDNLKALVNLIVGKNETDMPIRVKSYLGPIAEYHSNNRSGDVESEIYQLLLNGKIVILDLSVGSEMVRKAMALRIARHILNFSMARFHKNQPLSNIVIYVEEAHNLIGKEDELTGVWPRIAKEGAKAKIAFVYATQEPSSIHPNILANTENWFVTHLNNEDELRALGKFYDFSDFHASLKTAQDVGFARIKTLSSPFVVPTQINRFTPQMLADQYGTIRNGGDE